MPSRGKWPTFWLTRQRNRPCFGRNMTIHALSVYRRIYIIFRVLVIWSPHCISLPMQWIITFSAEDPFIGCDNHTERCSVSPAQLFCAVVPSLPNPFVQLYPVLVLCLILLCSCTLYLYSVQSFCAVLHCTCILFNPFVQLNKYTLYLYMLIYLCTDVRCTCTLNYSPSYILRLCKST